MAQQEIDVGSVAGDGTGDPLREAFTKINENFTELYSGNVQITGANVLVYSVAGRTGNIVLNVNDVSQAASKGYVDNSIAANLANVTTTITNSLNANITAANAVISNHAVRIGTLESNAATQATAITNLTNTKATIAYVDTSIDLALSSNAILANVQAVNANVAAANAAILLRANLSGANFTGNISANSIFASNYISTDTYFVGGTAINQGLGQQWANPAALFFGNSAQTAGSEYFQINIQNLDVRGTSDYVATADDGNDGSNYIAVGINNSQYNNPYYPGAYAHDSYVFNTGGNLSLYASDGNVRITSGNIEVPQITLTSGNVIYLNHNTSIRFSDGTVQSTAFDGSINVTQINANIAAANAAIVSLQANAAAQALDLDSLFSNAASQATEIVTLTANAAAQASSLNSINTNVGSYQIYANANAASQAVSVNSINANVTAANVNITTLLSNAAIQALELNNLQSNAQAQQSNIIALQSNAASQASLIDLINANVTAANTNIIALTANSATQAVQINLLNADVTAANQNITTLTANAAVQSLDIQNLYANINLYLSNVISSDANIAAANARIIIIDANLGSTSTNVSTLQSNAATQAVQIDLLNANIATTNIVKANLSGAIFSGNVQADFLLSNANVKVGSTLEVGDTNTINYPGLGAVFVGDVDSYYQVVIQNKNTGSNASGDFVITADDGNDSDKYLNIGINSSNFSGTFAPPTGDTGFKEAPYDGYFNVVGGNAIIRTNSNVFLVANTSLVGVSKDADFQLFNCNLAFSDGSIQRSAIPDVPALYANIGVLSLFQSNIVGNASYTPNNAANYNGTITNIQQALDELAARLRALGG